MSDDADLIAASTVLLLRDGDRGIESLMLRRNSKIAFGGMWVFPGGRVDDHEIIPGDELESARRAAVRESHEEAGLHLDADSLVPWSHWVPPLMAAMNTPGPRRRFSTWFFAAPAPRGPVVIDDGEIKEHEWMSVGDAMAKREAGEIELVPPTWITLHQMARYDTVDAALTAASGRDPERFVTRPLGGTPPVIAWHGDAGYESGDRDAAGHRHRLVLDRAGWVYERSPLPDGTALSDTTALPGGARPSAPE